MLNQSNDAMDDFRWIFKKRKIDGTFISTYDSVLAVKAFYALAEMLGPVETNANFKLRYSDDRKIININKNVETKTIQFQYNGENRMFVTAEGFGLAYVTVSHKYRTLLESKNQIESSIDVIEKANKLELRVTSTFKESEKSSNMIVIEVNLPSGYEFDQTSPDDIIRVRQECHKNIN
jgi:hypothetical protein